MADTTTQALQTLARQDVSHLRLSGLILEVLVQRNIISRHEAAAIVGEAIANMPQHDGMEAWSTALHTLKAEFG